MIIKIDTETEFIPKEYAKKVGVSKQVVNNWMKRGKVEFRKIPELDLTLIKLGMIDIVINK